MSYDVIIGIDCGMSGGIASYYNNKYHAVKMPRSVEDVTNYLRYLTGLGRSIVTIEKVMLRRGDEKDGKVFRMDKLIRNYNEIITILKMLNVDFVEVFPRTWQSYIAPSVSTDDYTHRKHLLKEFCTSILGQYIKVTLWNSDAILLVLFTVKKRQFDPLFIEANKYQRQTNNTQKYLNL